MGLRWTGGSRARARARRLFLTFMLIPICHGLHQRDPPSHSSKKAPRLIKMGKLKKCYCVYTSKKKILLPPLLFFQKFSGACFLRENIEKGTCIIMRGSSRPRSPSTPLPGGRAFKRSRLQVGSARPPVRRRPVLEEVPPTTL